MLREFSAGGIVCKKENNQILWLLRRPKGGPGYYGNLGWSFPKGWIDTKLKVTERESLEEAALREVEEEGGVKAKIIAKLPTLKVFFIDKNGEKVMKFITYFVMEWFKDLKQGFGKETKETRWVTKQEALELLVHQNEKDLLEKIQDPTLSASKVGS